MSGGICPGVMSGYSWSKLYVNSLPRSDRRFYVTIPYRPGLPVFQAASSMHAPASDKTTPEHVGFVVYTVYVYVVYTKVKSRLDLSSVRV